MLYVVSYDIADDSRRVKVADILKDFGRRVQYSVFEALIDDELAAHMRQRVLALIDTDEDNLRIYRLCRGCETSLEVIGQGRRSVRPDVWIV